MILPEGNSKKYIKVVIGIYVLFTIVSPIITKLSGKEIKVSDIIDLDEYIEEAETSTKAQNQMKLETEENIMNIYISGIKEDMKSKIEEKDYIVNKIDISVANDGSYTIEEIILDVENKTKYINKKSKEEKNNENEISNTEEVKNVEKVNEVNKVEVNISKDSDDESKENISNDKNILTLTQKLELKEYISSVYEVNKNYIIIN